MIDLSTLKETLNDRAIAVMGLGKTGLSVIQACEAVGIPTLAWDDQQDRCASALESGAEIVDLNTTSLENIAFLILAPGIPFQYPSPHPVVKRFQSEQIEVFCDIELFNKVKPSAKTIGITGTNGKSTTTALIGHILKEAGKDVAIGGNIGDAVLTLPDFLSDNPDHYYVFELSSYQLDLCPHFSPKIAALLNISPDHLERHGGLNGYIKAKQGIFNTAEQGVIAVDDEHTQNIFKTLNEKKPDQFTPISTTKVFPDNLYINDNCILIDNSKQGNRPILDLKELKQLSGRHNWQNIAVAYAICDLVGISTDTIAEAIRSFPGLEHRQQCIAEQNNVLYINDSKATNDEAASKALATFEHIYWIAGGLSKEGGFTQCQKHLSDVEHVFLIGQDAPILAQWLEKNEKPYTMCGTLDIAVRTAHLKAQENQKFGHTILLSPACASWDQFKNFEERGDHFTKLVHDLTLQNDASLTDDLGADD